MEYSKKLDLSAPWYTYRSMVNELFDPDPEIQVKFNEEEKEIRLYVDNPVKAYALTQLLPTVKEFGNVKCYVNVIPSNSEPKIDLIRAAFDGNPVFSFSETEQLFDDPIHYVVFKNKVVQFYNDQLDDIHGNISTLYQELAKEVLGEGGGIYYCTDLPIEETPDDRPLIEKLQEIRDKGLEKFEH